MGAFLGGRLLGLVPDAVLLPALAAILLMSAGKIWRHAPQAETTAGARDSAWR